jgi:hypothetical protein
MTGAAKPLLQAQEPETNFTKADARHAAVALIDAAGCSTGCDAQKEDVANPTC